MAEPDQLTQAEILETFSMQELLARLREKQLAIVKQLPPALLDEYMRLEATIATIRGEIATYSHAPSVGIVPTQFGKAKRIPLYIHKKNVIETIRLNGPMPRSALVMETNVPAGSLSAILKGDEFVRDEEGCWGLREDQPGKKRPGRKQPGPSAPTAK